MGSMGIKTQAQFIPIIADGLGKSTQATALSGQTLNNRIIDFMNWGQERICRAYNFDELSILNTQIYTIPGQLSYPLLGTSSFIFDGNGNIVLDGSGMPVLSGGGNGGFALTSPKDIQSIRLIDDQNSIKLERFHVRKFDEKFPYPTNFAWQYPRIYTLRGLNIELFRIPDQYYNLYVTYPSWPTPFTIANTTQVSDFYYKDELIVTAAILEGYMHFAEYEQVKVWEAVFQLKLKEAIHAEGDVDWEPHASQFQSSKGGYQSGEPWLDPYATATDPLFGYAG